MPAVRWVGYGAMLVCCLLLLGRAEPRWWQKPGTPSVLICATIAAYLVIGTGAFFVTDAEWRPTVVARDILRQVFFFLVLLAALCGGRALLARIGVEPLLKGVLAILIASSVVVLATPLLRHWDVLLTFRLPFRLDGAFTDPNEAGFIGCVTVALALVLAAYAKQGKLSSYVGLAVGTAAALASLSRTAILVVCGILILLPLSNGRGGWRIISLGSLVAGLVGLATYATVASGLWPLRDLALGRDLDRIEFCLPLPRTGAGLLSDCEILLAARDTLAGDAPLNWRRAFPIDIWQGVAVDGPQRRVTELSLPGMSLNGRIPPELGDLDQLATLRLNDNRLTGSVPVELASLPNLEKLWLANNYLAGDLPIELAEFAPLPDLSDDIVEYIEIPEQPEIDVAAFAKQPLLPLPASAGVAAVSADNLFCSPEQIDAGLLADCNVLLAVRDVLAGGMPLNWRRDIPIGSWQGVIVGDTAPIRVAGLSLQEMGLNGRIPPELGDLDQLVLLALVANDLSGAIPPGLGRLAELRVLSLGANRLTGSIPPELGRLAKLHDLWLAKNRLTGSVPPEMEAFGAQAFGLIDEETARGSLTAPESVASYSPAQGIFCQPKQVDAGLLADCNVLLAVRDVLAGGMPLNWRRDIPIGSWQGIVVDPRSRRILALNLPGKGLNGRIPPQLGTLDQLATLRLSGNRLRGPIPPELGRLANLQILSLSKNNLTGPIPPELGQLARLRALWLAGNRLAGSAPPALFAIAEHDLTHISFCIPSYPHVGPDLLADCTRLLADRDTLAGTARLNWSQYVPIGFWQGIAVGGSGGRVVKMDLAEQGLSGRIPPEFGGLDQLVSLRLSRNQLKGTIPPELGGLVELRTLALESNLLTGTVPPELVRDDLALRLTGNNISILVTIQTSRRLSMWKEQLEEGLQSPFVGKGLMKLRRITDNLPNSKGEPEGIHNLYLALLGEAGIVPLALYCLFLLSLLRLRWSAPNSPARNVVVGWAVVMALFSMFYHHLLTQGPFMFLAGLSCALAAGEASRRQPRDAAPRPA